MDVQLGRKIYNVPLPSYRMYVRIDKQKEFIEKAIHKASSYRKLSKKLSIPRSSLFRYYSLESMPKKRFEDICNFLKIKKKSLKFQLLEENWRQKIGGKNSVKARKEKGTYEKQLKDAQKKGGLKKKNWHGRMKKENPDKYYKIQYENFKKIGGYKYITKNNERVRNEFEKQTADKLKKLGISYKYEPLINIGKKYFFPDFLIDNDIIIECTAWRGKEKSYKLKEKINILGKKYIVYVLIPKNLEKYYTNLKKNLIFDLKEVCLSNSVGRVHGC